MKIEIELEEVERLREKVSDLTIDRDDWKREAESYDQKELYDRAVRTSIRLFHDYMDCVFTHLGFGDWDHNLHIEEMRYFLGEHWHDSEKLTVNIGANISKKWKTAFLSFGILTKDMLTKVDSEKMLDE